MSSNGDDQLNWLATRYVLGELTEAERDAFESRLADDLSACEAVAGATRLTLALRSALADPIATAEIRRAMTGKPQRSRLAVAIAIATIAGVFLAMISLSRNSFEPFESNLASRSNRDAIELLSRWRTDMTLVDADSDDADDDIHDHSADGAVPGWLLAGVILEKHGAMNGHSNESQDN